MIAQIKDRKFEAWKHGLLDISKRNRLMSYKRSKRATLQIIEPGMTELYKRLVISGESLSFRRQINVGNDTSLTQLFYIMDKMDASIELSEGEIRSDLSSAEMERTLKNLRSKAKLSLEEQGVNILYLSFGFLKWKQKPSDDYLMSPIILVPVAIESESMLSPYHIKRLDEDIVINPTLEYALSSDFGLALPEFDPQNDDLNAFLKKVETLVSSNGWSVLRESNIGLLSFLKIVMYKDLEKYREKIFLNPVIKAFCGDPSELVPIDDSLRDFPHDTLPAADSCQVVNADATQQDAILLSRKGISFVLQGPPGTGKSQTITNIIAQALADGKKVLFVSEKMAALSVVHKRLTEAGLSDFCLSLHNYKAEKRAVIQDLVNTLDLPVRSINPGITDSLAVLEEKRAELNDYVNELEKVRQPLNRSIYDVLCELFSIDENNDYIISENVVEVTENEYRTRISLLKKLGNFFEQNGYPIYSSPWRDTSITLLTYDVRITITQKLAPLRNVLFGLVSTFSYLEESYGISRIWTFGDFEKLVDSLIDLAFIKEFDTNFCRPLSSENDCGTITSARQVLTDSVYQAANDGLSISENSDINDAVREKDLWRLKVDQLTKCVELSDRLNGFMPFKAEGTKAFLEQAAAYIRLLSINYSIRSIWFKNGKYDDLKREVSEWKILSDRIIAVRTQIDQVWAAGFYQLNYEELIQRFQTVYTSFFKRLSSQYRADKAVILAVRKDGIKKISDKECLSALEILREYYSLMKRFNSSSQRAKSLFGDLINGIDTDWLSIIAMLDECDPVNEYIKVYGLNNNDFVLLEKDTAKRTETLKNELNGEDLDSMLTMIENHLNSLPDIIGTYRSNLKYANSLVKCLSNIIESYEIAVSVLDLYYPGENMSGYAFNYLISHLDTLEKKSRSIIEVKEKAVSVLEAAGTELDLLPEISELFEEYYDVEKIHMSATELANKTNSISADEFIEFISAAFREAVISLPHKNVLEQFVSWFPKMNLAQMSITELSERISQCDSIEELQLWIAFSSLTKECSGHALADYVSYVEDNSVTAEHIVNIYKKAFLNKWLIDTVVNEKAVCLQNFHSYVHEKTISDFAVQDKNQLAISKARLADFLSHEKPSGINLLASAKDEASILRREAEKKRKIIPLRKLFKTIPSLLQKLKPCFMMSPLSVSYFLDSEMYSFDMVIFDEASQILPEDAVGAIYRGKQVIIAGDTKQMPPTSFFSAAAKNTDEDIDEDSDDYYPDIISESILDEANTCLPSCTLLWHYRSRDESLISFSNHRLYGGKLITFPNPSKIADRGLEYVYVHNGYYEGSGKNCNIREAQMCLALVIDHIKNHPDRSLGIIAFSEKQQAVIEDVISDYRIKNPQIESFFDDSKEEPFFVKNLENVQGDERDTIIFSICYARNIQGRMYQRYGPLSHEGGERRLNVAITRAKYNVKLVGSIMPTDIEIKPATKDGVKMLREYIYYAMQSEYTSAGASEDQFISHFTDLIVNMIEEEGYSCIKNIGSSSYKVDIGVKKAKTDECFIAGIECDGYNYSGARTARDRDILRRDIMSSFGWNLYHAWSMAWYLSPMDEKKRLLDFLSDCALKAQNQNKKISLDKTPLPLPSLTLDIDSMTSLVDVSSTVNTVMFDQYVYSDPTSIQFSYYDDNYTRIERLVMCVMETEQPIHKDELYQRLAPCFGRQKVTAPIKRTVDDCISKRLSDTVIEMDGFLYLKGRDITARVPHNGSNPRPIEHICPEELQDALYKVLSFAGALTRKDLVDETARQLGFARTGPKINDALTRECMSLERAGKIQAGEGKLFCV